MHDQPPVFGFQNTNESKETPDEQLGLPVLGGLRMSALVPFGEESKEWFRGCGPAYTLADRLHLHGNPLSAAVTAPL
jgi:hypothetical protein